MESMHLTARLAIEQNMYHTAAFSARPDAPVRPVRERRRLPTIAPAVHRLGQVVRRRSPLRHASA